MKLLVVLIYMILFVEKPFCEECPECEDVCRRQRDICKEFSRGRENVDCDLDVFVEQSGKWGAHRCPPPAPPAPPVNNFTTGGRVGRFGVIQTLQIKQTGCYRLEVLGAAGGTSTYKGIPGGRGASVTTTEKIFKNTALYIVAGHTGVDTRLYGNGGGGSYVYSEQPLELFAAAGGGGGSDHSGQLQHETADGQASESGSPNQCYHYNPIHKNAVKGGENGTGGLVPPGSDGAGAGAGWLTDGKGTCGGKTRAGNWTGGYFESAVEGGFGGGSCRDTAAGGGGGFSGGAAGGYCGTISGAGGGGSFCRTHNQCNKTTGGNQNKHGQVIITGPLTDVC